MPYKPIQVTDIELSAPMEDITGLDGCEKLQALIRMEGYPVGWVAMPVYGDCIRADDLVRRIIKLHSNRIIGHLLRKGLMKPIGPDGLNISELIKTSPFREDGPWPLVTVAVCTRNRTEDLSVCLESLTKLAYPNLEILVIDNAPQTKQTEQFLEQHHPQMRYVCESRPGLNWARNRVLEEANGEIIAFTDDDVVVDPNWVNAFVRVFSEDSEIMAVTGLVVPYELATEAQFLFELSGGFGRGYQRKWFKLDPDRGRRKPFHLGAGIFGTGANMAFRRRLFEEVGAFDPALDVGTVTNGGGDLEMFFRVLQEGHPLVYEPGAVVRHRHRREYPQLKTQLTNNGIGLYAYFVRSILAYPKESPAIIRFGLWWLWKGHILRLLIGLTRPHHFPLDLILAELSGCFIGFFRYFKARRIAANIDKTYVQDSKTSAGPEKAFRHIKSLRPVAVRTIDLCQTLNALNDIQEYRQVQVFVKLKDIMVGKVDIQNFGHSLSVTFLRDAIVDGLAPKLIEPNSELSDDVVNVKNLLTLIQHYCQADKKPQPLTPTVSVSVVVATLDRPEDLRACLKCLLFQKTSRKVEIIVVDNNPASGLTPPVVAEYPGVLIVSEPRRGLAYARNAGFQASSGDVVIATDDDVILPSRWLEKLVAPFAQVNVMAVTGNVLPREMETTSQYFFEVYGGLGRGFKRREYDTEWFASFKLGAVHTWEIGATANAAFRAPIFSNPRIGLMDEALGPGMPSGVGEDTYLFYKILKEGYSIVYEPSAYVWHKHRSSLRSLRQQVYNYSKGHVAYHLTTIFRERDLRAFYHLLVALPKFHLKRTLRRLAGRGDYPISLIFLEIKGNLAGIFALLKSYRRVKREGRSAPYLPVSKRTTSTFD